MSLLSHNRLVFVRWMDKAKQKRMRRQVRIIYNDKGPIVGGIGAMRNEMRDKDST